MGRTDRQADMMIPIYPPNFVCGGYEYLPFVGYIYIYTSEIKIHLDANMCMQNQVVNSVFD
jgi:hypothetical protein